MGLHKWRQQRMVGAQGLPKDALIIIHFIWAPKRKHVDLEV